jgi:hypothetical protein
MSTVPEEEEVVAAALLLTRPGPSGSITAIMNARASRTISCTCPANHRSSRHLDTITDIGTTTY